MLSYERWTILVMEPMRKFAYSCFDLVEGRYDYMVMHQICNRASFDEVGRSRGVCSAVAAKFQKNPEPKMLASVTYFVKAEALKICPKKSDPFIFSKFLLFCSGLKLDFKRREKNNRLGLWSARQSLFSKCFHSLFKQFCPKLLKAVLLKRNIITMSMLFQRFWFHIIVTFSVRWNFWSNSLEMLREQICHKFDL